MAFVKTEVQGAVEIITIDRPKALNALNPEVLADLKAAFEAVDQETIRCIVLTGEGDKSFVAGADIGSMSTMTKAEGEAFGKLGNDVFLMIESFPIPVIAAVNGFALGGGVEISMACDIRFASEKAFFGQPEILIGLIPGWGGTQRLPRIIGMGRAKELILGGAQINAQRAYEIGLVNRVFPPDDLMPETQKFARKLAGMPGFALKMAKHSINFGYDLALDNACRIETECCAQCFSTDDQKEGMKAFLEKRKPVFTGR